jgi:hypothetical protein
MFGDNSVTKTLKNNYKILLQINLRSKRETKEKQKIFMCINYIKEVCERFLSKINNFSN